MKIPTQLPAIVAQIGSGVLLLSSIICLALKRSAFDMYLNNTKSTTLTAFPKYGSGGFLATYPEHLLPVTQGPVIAATSFGIMTGLAILLITAWTMKKKQSLKLTSIPKTMGLALLAVTPLLGTIAMIFEFARNGGSSHFDPEHIISASANYDKGSFTLGRWTCETPKFINVYENQDFGVQCAGEKGSRVLLVFMWLSSLVTLGGLIWDWRTTQFVVERKVENNRRDMYYWL